MDNPFWVSLYTTKELNDTGYDAIVEKYGLVDGINSDNTKYKFLSEEVNQFFSDFTFESGFINASTGAETTVSGNNFLITDYINIEAGNNYTFTDLGNNSDVIRWWIYEYDENKSFIKSMLTVTKNIEFTARGKHLRFMIQGANGTTLNPSDISSSSTSINPILKLMSETNTISVWNAGNVTVEPETMHLKITATGTNGMLEIRNKTTGDTFKVNAEFGGDLVIDGMNTQLKGTNVFRDTNRRYISLASGANQFEVIGQYTDIEFDFRYYYK